MGHAGKHDDAGRSIPPKIEHEIALTSVKEDMAPVTHPRTASLPRLPHIPCSKSIKATLRGSTKCWAVKNTGREAIRDEVCS